MVVRAEFPIVFLHLKVLFFVTPAPHRQRSGRRQMEPRDGRCVCTSHPDHGTYDILGEVAVLQDERADAWSPLHAGRAARHL